ncbi:hypothetical protein BB561_000141 [Smittium simulii]|uniref:Uncharacterized protein n=1 Tax=Smittium simulii TaxID=133385 RepID=A0A2T9Z0B0_9FUNG|nr:hypothetical protein BB561_000141 [Smittium simulii]
MPPNKFGGFVPPKAHFSTKLFSKIIGTSLFFWVLYRARQDYAVVLKLQHPWDAHHGHDSSSNHKDEEEKH